MSYASQQQGLTGPKLVALIIALAIVGGVGTGMVLFLTVDAVKEMVERVTTVNVKEEEPPPPEEEPPPPPPEDIPEVTSPPPPNVPQMPFEFPTPNKSETTQKETPKGEPIKQASTNNDAPVGEPVKEKVPSKARGVKTKGERGWVQRITNDYPSRAAREEIEGTVGVRVTVTADGRATGCSVTSSSGSSILDDAACKAVERYARFEPALNDAGEPINAPWSTRITYRLN